MVHDDFGNFSFAPSQADSIRSSAVSSMPAENSVLRHTMNPGKNSSTSKSSSKLKQGWLEMLLQISDEASEKAKPRAGHVLSSSLPSVRQVASCLRGAFPPVDFLAVCIVLAIAHNTTAADDFNV